MQQNGVSEETPLIPLTENEDNGDLESPQPTSSTASEFSVFSETMDELEKPWPATFERSISLLAGPTMDTDFIDEITKSPKITPNMNALRRVRLVIENSSSYCMAIL